MVRNGVQWHAFRGILPRTSCFGTLSRTLFAQAAKGSSFLSHGRKKRSKESPPAARISVKMEHIRLKRKNSELRSSNSLRFLTPSVLHFLNLKSMRPELGLSYNFASLVGRLRFARWATSLRWSLPLGGVFLRSDFALPLLTLRYRSNVRANPERR